MSEIPSPQDLLDFCAKQGKAISPLLILTHNHPDPDAMATASTLAYVAEKLYGVRCRIAYGGIIGRIENQRMAKTLRLPVRPLRADDLKRYENVALVDTQPPFQNNPFKVRRRAVLVIDHHAAHPKTQADFLWVDHSAGATATIAAEILFASGLEIPTRLATAIAYGISSETENLGRDAGPRDVQAYLSMVQRSNTKALSRIQNPPHPRAFFSLLSRAIRDAFTLREVIGVHLGEVPTPDRVAQMADFLLTHENMKWSFCTGRYGGRLYVSLRSRKTDARAGRLLTRLLGAGSAGGHCMIAGGSIVMPAESAETDWRDKEAEVRNGFLKAVGIKDPLELQYPFAS
ncbi:MAG: DHH family phosphoesterase [Elusimicrobiota bacterium]|jgi:nanoRNase/pAp phosphatase (c-di-AMP/oligoRNAs hydrolase)